MLKTYFLHNTNGDSFMETNRRTNEKTRYRLAQALKECMTATSLDSITVTQIAETCKVTRQTFYRNFQDKYDLINWYFDKLLLESFAQMGNGNSIYEGLVKKFSYILQEQVFFAGAFRSDDKNSLKEHDFELILQFYADLIRQKTGKKPSDEILFQLELYCRGSIYMTVEWVLSEKKESPAKMAQLLADAMPAGLSALFCKLGVLK